MSAMPIEGAPDGSPMLTFHLTDAQGARREYITTLHPARAGQGIMFQLLALAAEPGTRLITLAMDMPEVIGAIQAHLKGEDEGAGDFDLQEAVSGVDWVQIGSDLRKTLGDPRLAPLVFKLFEFTIRDGADVSQGHAFDMAYRGNYVELLTAAWRIISFNRFFPLPGT